MTPTVPSPPPLSLAAEELLARLAKGRGLRPGYNRTLANALVRRGLALRDDGGNLWITIDGSVHHAQRVAAARSGRR